MKETNGNGCVPSIAQAIEEMKAEQGGSFSLDHINLAELERRTGISRSRLRTLKKKGFRASGEKTRREHNSPKLKRYEELIDSLLRNGVRNSTVVLNRLREAGYDGGLTILKEYISARKDLLPAKRSATAPQGSRGRRYVTAPGEAFQIRIYAYQQPVLMDTNKPRVKIYLCFQTVFLLNGTG